MNPINAKSVQLNELHAFACDFVYLYLSESLDLLKISILNILVFTTILTCVVVSLTCVSPSLCTTLCSGLCIHFSTCSLECTLQFSTCGINAC